ncbi:hypothetical protein [Gordonia paraffinivorans]|uniref:hypothetical protein n=1 Tax=Gordonia paraffinivorans TaxID=175628 RepID=UPI001445B310|nr:hypothetical protein [Gordonia paraffinivorans]
MTNTENTITVFTAQGPTSILNEGGSGSWKLDPARARKCTYLVCTQNAYNAEPYADATNPHGSAFLVGKISRITPVDDRWRIEFSEYALIDYPEVWGGHRNPVRYTNLDDLGIQLDGVEWKQAAPTEAVVSASTPEVAAPRALTIQEAKAGLAQTYGVDAGAIEIVIRG